MGVDQSVGTVFRTDLEQLLSPTNEVRVCFQRGFLEMKGTVRTCQHTSVAAQGTLQVRVGCQWDNERRPFEFRSIVTYRRKPPPFVQHLGESLVVHVKRSAPQDSGQRKRSRTQSTGSNVSQDISLGPSDTNDIDAYVPMRVS